MSTSADAIPGHCDLDADFCDDDSNSFVSNSGTRHWIPKCPDEFKPRIGMVFTHVDDAIKFYKHYAYIAGFSVRLSTTNTRSDGVLTQKYLVCSKEGFKGKPTLVDTLSVVHQNIIMHCGKYRIRATKAHHLVKDLCGGFNNVGATVTFKNFKRDLKLYIGLNDAQMIVDNLLNKKNTCQGYSFEYYVDEHGSLSRLFWADQIARANYIIFGDVVSFDATYRTNKYNLVFVPFTGVDNHHRSVTLAAGLISKEDADSYTWLLTCFKNFVVREPSVIVTDQDAAMKVAISHVFPTSRHMFCMWHITEKLQSKLADMYELRGSWIPIYFRDVTMGGLLRTTSRFESENSFFGRYIYGFMTLVEFFTGFNNAMDLQRNIRVQLYIESRSSSPFLQSKHKLEKHASEISQNLF
ncbi:hypothetical protein QQ045_000020 [Rhodiola kirilowii]